MKLAAGVQYCGTHYSGWQSQANADISSIQSEVEKALSTVADHPIEVICAGRTDKGVHATGQVIHFETDATRSERSWIYGANNLLPRDIVVSWVKEVSEDFHARFSALSRTYRYTIYNDPIRPVQHADWLTWHFAPLDVERMRKAATHLIGEHDFTSFRAAGCQSRSPMRHVDAITITRQEKRITIEITANAFLYHMVRNIVGTLLKIGEGRAELEWTRELLEARDRTLSAKTAPASGLSLVGVAYPEHFMI